MEYTVSWEVLEAITKELPDHLGAPVLSGFTTNGSRIYQDCSHLEYASPESCGPLDASATDHAGKATVKDLSDLVGLANNKPPILRCAATYNPEGGVVHTKGYHENYMIPAPESQQSAILKDVLSAHLATRAIWSGAGIATLDGYRLSQKGADIGAPAHEGFSNRAGVKLKQMAAIFDVSNGDSKISHEWGLVEVRHADPHMLPAGTFLALATSSLVLRLIEQRTINAGNQAGFTYTNPVRASHATDSWLLPKKPKDSYNLLWGGERDCLEMQKSLALLAYKMCNDGVQLPPDEQEAAERWCKIVHDTEQGLRTRNLKPLFGSVEWATKAYIMEQKGIPLHSGDMRASQIDQNWAMLHDNSISKLVEQRQLNSDRLAREIHERSKHYKDHAPQTRAKVRSDLIKRFSSDSHLSAHDISWSTFIAAHDDGTDEIRIGLSDPYATTLETQGSLHSLGAWK